MPWDGERRDGPSPGGYAATGFGSLVRDSVRAAEGSSGLVGLVSGVQAEANANAAAATSAISMIDAVTGLCRNETPSGPVPGAAMGAIIAAMGEVGAQVDLVNAVEAELGAVVAQAAEAYAIAASTGADFNEIVPEPGHNFAAGKFKWLIDHENMFGSSHRSSVEFFPWNQIPGPSGLGGEDPANQSLHGRIPPNVPSRREMSWEMGTSGGDTFRYATGKMWLHQAHIHGLLPTEPTEGATDLSFHGIHKPEFSFFNKTNVLWSPSPSTPVTLGRPDRIDRLDAILPPKEWFELQRILGMFTQRSPEISFPIFQESFKILVPAGKNLPQQSRWNWRNYLYGLPYAGQNLQNFRKRSQTTSDGEYRRFGPRSFFKYDADFSQVVESKNIWPVVPFYRNAGASGRLQYGTTLEEFRDPSLRPGGSYVHTFHDHVTMIPDFLTKEQMDKTDFNTGIYADIYGVYNHYDRIYEEILSPFYEEVRLPNYYKFKPGRSVQRNRESRVREELLMQENLLNLVTPGNSATQHRELLRERAATQYGIFVHRRWAEVSNLDVYADPGTETFKKVFKEKDMFPMYTGIEITTNTESKLVQAIRIEDRDNLFNLFFPLGFPNDDRGIGNGPREMRYYFERMKVVTQLLGSSTQEEDAILSSQSAIVGDVSDAFEGIDLDLGNVRRRLDGEFVPEGDRIQPSAKTKKVFSDIVESDIQYTDLNEWLETLENNRPTSGRSMPQEVFRSQLSRAIMKSKIKNIVEEKYRTNFNDVLNGHPAYSEIVGYRVDKMSEEGVLIQTFMFGNREDVDIVKYVDSQVEYGKRYLYKVSSIVMIIGTRYAYLDCMTDAQIRRFHEASDPADRRHADGRFFFGVVHTPSVRIAVVPMHTREIAILDKPPVPPDVNIIPYKGVKNKILFWLNSNTGEMVANPVILEPDDHGQFDMVRISQRQVYAGSVPRKRSDGTTVQPVKFKNDDMTKVFEIFRIDTPPLAWDDFYENKLTRIESDATSTAFEDDVLPNKKYYYTFRSEDVHGHVSNPTNIYEVELISEDDMVYMKMSIWNFPKPVEETKMVFRKKIMITPAMLQTILPLPGGGSFLEWERHQEVGSVGTPDNPGETLWGKQFKCRITSKSTGKQVDINFKFQKKYTRIEDNTEINS